MMTLLCMRVCAQASYVRAFLEDEQRYFDMFKWKNAGLLPSFQNHLDRCVHYAECRICEKAHEAREEASRKRS